jgi:serine/threonine-protein kinase RsbW
LSASTGAGSLREIHCRVPADADRLAEMRHALSRWATGIGMPDRQRDELVLAAYEAMANSVEHAYGEAPGADDFDGVVDLHAAHTPDGTVIVTVTDYGQWQPPVPSDGIRGRGILLMRALADDTTITRVDTGTTVTMTWALPSHRH